MVWARRSFSGLVVLYLIYALPFLSWSLAERMEHRYPVFDMEQVAKLSATEDNPVYIVVLGAGKIADPRLDYNQMLSAAVTMRLMEGIRVHRMIPESYMVTSASAVHGELSQAEALRQAAIQLGVDASRIYTQDDPTNTCEEAKAFVRDHGVGTRVIIATSALHMRRSMMLFEQFGAEPTAAPTAFRVKRNPDRPFRVRDYMPSMSNVRLLESTMKENVGYWVGARC